jgi:phage baseplate assembly protein W
MTGMSRNTGRTLDFDAHLAQSIHDILTTPKGSRALRRSYGSDLPLLIDAPMNGETMVDLFAATAEALAEWEPRFTLRRVEIDAASAGRLSLRLSGEVAGAATALQTEVAA